MSSRLLRRACLEVLPGSISLAEPHIDFSEQQMCRSAVPERNGLLERRSCPIQLLESK